MSITWGAGGSTKDRSLELAGMMEQDYGLETLIHLTCTNMEKGSIDAALKVRALLVYIYLPPSDHYSSGSEEAWHSQYLGSTRRCVLTLYFVVHGLRWSLLCRFAKRR